MRHLLAIYRAQLIFQLQQQLQYRLGLLIWILGMAIEPVVYLVVWRTVAESRPDGTVAGFSGAAFAAYYILWIVVRTMNIALTPWAFEERVQRGGLSPMLLRPVHPFHLDLAGFVSFKLVSLLVLTPIVGGLWLIFRPAVTLAPLDLVGFGLAIWTGFVMRFILVWALGLVTFWVVRVSAIFDLFFAVELLLGGRLVPLELLPGPAAAIGRVLPFYYAYGFPIELALGRLSPEAVLRGFGMQALWALVSGLALALLWQRGLRRYTAVGA
ncbi:MAG: ABC-2 family transporter protein [Caldilineae bacterium]|nr:ABC-2 family transporter protein [Caldilineae bacterium]